jgi:hypothetical protein
MATYQEEIAQWRQQRAQQQIADRCNQIRQEHAQAARERDQLIAENDMDAAELRDDECKQLEQEWAHYNPPRQQVHPQWQTWINRNAAFIEREGQRGVNAVTDALAYMQRPRNPNSNDPRYTGMGMTPQQIFTRQGLSRLEDLLETHGAQFYGVRYDKNEKTLTPNGAAKVSGVSAKEYNEQSQRVGAAGLFSWQKKEQGR